MHRTVFIWQMEIISKLLNKKYEQKSTSSDLYYEKEILAERFIGRLYEKISNCHYVCIIKLHYALWHSAYHFRRG